VKCDYHTIGCPWIGQLKNWEVREGGRGGGGMGGRGGGGGGAREEGRGEWSEGAGREGESTGVN